MEPLENAEEYLTRDTDKQQSLRAELIPISFILYTQLFENQGDFKSEMRWINNEFGIISQSVYLIERFAFTCLFINFVTAQKGQLNSSYINIPDSSSW